MCVYEYIIMFIQLFSISRSRVHMNRASIQAVIPVTIETLSLKYATERCHMSMVLCTEILIKIPRDINLRNNDS